MRCGGAIELFGDRRHLGWQSDFKVTRTPTQIDHFLIVRILENTLEVALAQTLTVAAEQVERLYTNRARRRGDIAAHQRGRSATYQVERLLSR